MANIKSAKKRARQAVKRTEINRSRTSRIRTYVKKVETAIASGDKTAALAALKEAEPEVARGVTKGVLHRNTAARKISRLTHRVRAMGAPA
jgi:small subunit ribosomal protein S20